jgi:hypothetical protein
MERKERESMVKRKEYRKDEAKTRENEQRTKE